MLLSNVQLHTFTLLCSLPFRILFGIFLLLLCSFAILSECILFYLHSLRHINSVCKMYTCVNVHNIVFTIYLHLSISVFQNSSVHSLILPRLLCMFPTMAIFFAFMFDVTMRKHTPFNIILGSKTTSHYYSIN